MGEERNVGERKRKKKQKQSKKAINNKGEFFNKEQETVEKVKSKFVQ